MRKVFPLSFRGKSLRAVVVSTALYTLMYAVLRVLCGVVSPAGWLGAALNILTQFVLLYAVSGIAVSVLYACDLLEQKK